jgi:hypothetical protein
MHVANCTAPDGMPRTALDMVLASAAVSLAEPPLIIIIIILIFFINLACGRFKQSGSEAHVCQLLNSAVCYIVAEA